MRKDYEMDEENLQEAEDEFYNYYHGEKKKTNTVPVVIALAAVMLLAGFVIGKGSNLLTRSQNEAERDVERAKDVAEQTKTDHGGLCREPHRRSRYTYQATTRNLRKK